MAGIDLYIGYLPVDEKLKQVPIIDQDSWAIAASSTLLETEFGSSWPALQTELISDRDFSIFKGLPFIVPRDKRGQKARCMEALFAYSGFIPKIGFQSDNGELNARMCIAGTGVYIGSFDYCNRKFRGYFESGADSIKVFTVKGPLIPLGPVICYEKGKRLHPAEKSFIEAAQKFLANPIR